MINIGASNAGDQFYRYKMPAIQSKIEGRGNGIKTNVVNLVEVSKALARPPMYTLKFFGNDLGALTKFDEKSGLAIVNGGARRGKARAEPRRFHQALCAVLLVRESGDDDRDLEERDYSFEV